MMVTYEAFDSQAFGGAVLKLSDWSENDNFVAIEAQYTQQYHPCYAYISLHAEDLESLHEFENFGFRIVDYQLTLEKDLVTFKEQNSNQNFYIDNKLTDSDMKNILTFSDQIFSCDRIYMDPKISHEVAYKRYQLYIQKSFFHSDEELVAFKSCKDNEIIGFHSHKIVNQEDILQFLLGIRPCYQNKGAASCCINLLFEDFKKREYKKVITHISANNYKNMEFEFKKIQFTIKQASCVLRKLY